MNGGEILLVILVGVALVGRLFFGKRLLWLPLSLVRGILALAVSSFFDRNRWR